MNNLMTAKEMVEEILTEIDFFNYHERDGEYFSALGILFDKFDELKEHYNIHHLKDVNFDINYCKKIAKIHDITNVEDGLKS
tara:strand:- start:1802 stop:2047 length:246 start_codon:yes stop_codon:yes gene_type:complete